MCVEKMLPTKSHTLKARVLKFAISCYKHHAVFISSILKIVAQNFSERQVTFISKGPVDLHMACCLLYSGLGSTYALL